ncbi:MAG: polysaccharide deacetylase family protein [Thermoanaerobaculia bacterium]
MRELARRAVPLHTFAIVVVCALLPIILLVLQATAELEGSVFGYTIYSRATPVVAKIDSMDEGQDSMTISGTGTAGALIFLLRDGKAIRTATTSPDGRFSFRLPLETNSASFSVAAVSSSDLKTASFVPNPSSLSSPQLDLAIARESVRSNKAQFVESLTRGSKDERSIVLSFDAGSNDEGALQILDVLRANHIRTTIFLTGQFIRKYPAIVKRIVEDGHEVGNHTWDHPHLTTFAQNRRQRTLPGMTRERLQDELRRTADAFHALTGHEMSHYWRAPFGEENSEIRGWAAELGYLHVGWTRGRRYNLDSLDWVVDRQSPLYHSPEEVASRMLSFDVANHTTLNGGIILMHLGTDRDEGTRVENALPEMIERFRDRGFRFVTVTELRSGEGNAG